MITGQQHGQSTAGCCSSYPKIVNTSVRHDIEDHLNNEDEWLVYNNLLAIPDGRTEEDYFYA